MYKSLLIDESMYLFPQDESFTWEVCKCSLKYRACTHPSKAQYMIRVLRFLLLEGIYLSPECLHKISFLYERRNTLLLLCTFLFFECAFEIAAKRLEIPEIKLTKYYETRKWNEKGWGDLLMTPRREKYTQQMHNKATTAKWNISLDKLRNYKKGTQLT